MFYKFYFIMVYQILTYIKHVQIKKKHYWLVLLFFGGILLRRDLSFRLFLVVDVLYFVKTFLRLQSFISSSSLLSSELVDH